MKKFNLFILMLVVSFCTTTTATAQVFGEHAKQEIKVGKTAKKQAKQKTKEGWKTSSIAMGEMLQRLEYFVRDVTPEGKAKYVTGKGMSKGQFYDAARAQAMELARLDIASKLKTQLVSEAETKLGNTQENGDVSSVVNTIRGMKSLVKNKLYQAIVAYEAYRELPNGLYEVDIILTVEREQAYKEARQNVVNEMKKGGDKMMKEIDEMGWED